MKRLFPEYRQLTAEHYIDAWSSAVFVFDTNVLLNLYRYRSDARKQMLDVLNELRPRVWIPHHVALEFHRNRLQVIASQSRSFEEVKNAISIAQSSLKESIGKLNLDRRHSSIDAAPLLDGFEEVANTFVEHLKALEASQQTITSPDPILDAIEEIFDGCVGPAPRDQSEIDRIYADAEARFKRNMPPGLRDISKETLDHYDCGGITYRHVYGDVLIWQQILSHAADENIKSLVFVTDDAKDDWWRVIRAPGPQKVGPRPEIIEEAKRRATLNQFVMYSSERFLKYAKEYINAEVSASTLTEAKEIAKRPEVTFDFFEAKKPALQQEESLYAHLISRYENVENGENISEFIATRGSKEHIYRIIPVEIIDDDTHFMDICLHAMNICELEEVSRYLLVFMVDDPDLADSVTQKIEDLRFRSGNKSIRKVRVLIGYLDKIRRVFLRMREMPLSRGGLL